MKRKYYIKETNKPLRLVREKEPYRFYCKGLKAYTVTVEDMNNLIETATNECIKHCDGLDPITLKAVGEALGKIVKSDVVELIVKEVE